MLVGEVKSVRVYATALGADALEQNRRVDDIRFHRAAPGETNVTVIARYGRFASEESGVYNVVGSWTFSARDATTRSGSKRELLGYTLQTWDGGSWVDDSSVDCEPEAEGMSYEYVEGESPANVRLVWRWEIKGLRINYN